MMRAKLFGGRTALRRYIAVAALFVTTVAAAASADNDGKKSPRREQQVFAELGITQEQQAELRAIHAQAVPTKRVYQKEMEVVRAKIKLELQKDKPSKSALNKYAAEMGNLNKQMNLAMIINLIQIKDVLTPEQFSALSARGFIGGPDVMRMHAGKSGGDRASVKQRGSDPGERQHPKHKYNSGDKRPRMCCDHDCKLKKGDRVGGGFIETPASATPVTPVPPIGTLPEGTNVIDEAVPSAE